MWKTLFVAVTLGVVLLSCTQPPPPTATPGPTPTKPASDYSIAQLDRWQNAHGDGLFRIPGVTGIGLDERAHRITIYMAPRRGTREELEAALSTLDVPRDAFDINVGCVGASQWGGYLTEVVDVSFRDSISFSVEAASQVSYGETLELKLVLLNTRDETMSFYRGGRPSHDFVVSASDGTEVWHWLCAKVRQLPLDEETLEPGKSLELSGEWEQVDNQGNPVPAGEYVVRGVLLMEHPQKLVTSAHKVEVLPDVEPR